MDPEYLRRGCAPDYCREYFKEFSTVSSYIDTGLNRQRQLWWQDVNDNGTVAVSTRQGLPAISSSSSITVRPRNTSAD